MLRPFRITKSLRLFAHERKHLPAGVSSNVRLWHQICPTLAPCAIFIQRAKGSRIWDVDRNEYIDYRLGFGPVILGHADKDVHDRVEQAEQHGVIFALDHELEIIVAEKVRKAVPCAEEIRYSTTGTEATMAACRLARAYTQKDMILKFEGHYHGNHDTVLFSTDPPYTAPEGKPYPMSLGIPSAVRKNTLVERWNDFARVEKTVKKNAKKLAAIICEPVMGNAAVIPPEKGYLQHLLELCERHDILLIFDEVKTGFRLAMGGAQEYYRVAPHLATFAKSLGNGYPISLIAGQQEIMEFIGPKGVAHGGTFSSNPVSLAAATATLDALRRRHVHAALQEYGTALMQGMRRILASHGFDAIVQGHPAMFQMLFTELKKVTHYRELAQCNMNLFAQLQYELLKRGIMLDEDNGEPLFISSAHSRQDLKETLAAMDDALSHVKKAPRTPIGVR